MRIDFQQVLCGITTDQGKVREENQDAVALFKTPDEQWMFLIVCDGMGGHAGGRTASTLAVDAIGRGLMEELEGHSSPSDAIAAAIRRANTEVHERSLQEPELHGMGTTCALIALRADGKCWLAHVGDSRIFYILPEKIEQKTRDHTTVQRLVDGGLIDARDAEHHPDAGLLSRCIGVKPQVEPEVQGPFELQEGDRYLACSDGLTNEVDAKEIGAMILAFEPQNAVERLVMLANERGGRDNISIAACYIPGKHKATGTFNPKSMISLTPPLLTPERSPDILLSAHPGPLFSPPAPDPRNPGGEVLDEQENRSKYKKLWTKNRLFLVGLMAFFLLGLWVGYLLGKQPCTCIRYSAFVNKVQQGESMDWRQPAMPASAMEIPPMTPESMAADESMTPESMAADESMTPESMAADESMTPESMKSTDATAPKKSSDNRDGGAQLQQNSGKKTNSSTQPNQKAKTNPLAPMTSVPEPKNAMQN